MSRPPKRQILAYLSALLLVAVWFPPPLAAGSLTLAWDRNREDDLGGYKVYYGTQSMEYDFVIDVGNVTQCTVRGLEPETLYYLALTAYDMSRNESDFSAEVSAVAGEEPPSSPPPSATLMDSGGGGGCFIATAAYGSYLNPRVKILGHFRDEFLVLSSLGRKSVQLYYQFAPRIANRMEKYGFLRFLTRQALLPLIGISSAFLKTASSTFLLLPLCLLILLAITLRSHLRQTR